MMSHHNSQRGSLIDDQMTHDMQCNSLLSSSSLDALCVCFAIFFVFMEVFCFFRECKLHLPPYCLYTQRHSQLPRIRLLWLFCILKKNKVKVRPNSSTDYISQSEIAGSFGYKLRPGDTSASLLGLGLRTVGI